MRVTVLWSTCEITPILLADGSHMTWNGTPLWVWKGACMNENMETSSASNWLKYDTQACRKYDTMTQCLVPYSGNQGYNHNQRQFLLRELNAASECWCYGNLNTHYTIMKGCLPENEVKSFNVHCLEATKPLLCAPKHANGLKVDINAESANRAKKI